MARFPHPYQKNLNRDYPTMRICVPCVKKGRIMRKLQAKLLELGTEIHELQEEIKKLKRKTRKKK